MAKIDDAEMSHPITIIQTGYLNVPTDEDSYINSSLDIKLAIINI
ncbi:hypothetical protein A3Q56_02600 [Intoshia linei]|uniref:Uncharacterized protein n=1 Tax=Intoshia linei TaxID=1819745 RepID=A0A177B7V8_9BILA|nr:hypothetical protein A3Q56_02600 [Intoshia linei]